MTDYGYWALTHEPVEDNELWERFYSSLDKRYPSYEILGATYSASEIVRTFTPYGLGSFLDNYHDELVKSGEILTDDEMQEHIEQCLIDWADDEILPALGEDMEEYILTQDSKHYHWAIQELYSLGLVEYTDIDTIEPHAHYSLSELISRVRSQLSEMS